MSLIWALVAFLLGVLVYVAVPLLVSPVLPDRLRYGLADWYWRQAATIGSRLQVIERTHGTHTILATNYKSEWGDEGVLSGKTGHWRDPGNHMGRFWGRPIGLVSEKFDVIMHPRHCEIGREHIRLSEQGNDTIPIQADGGEIRATETRAELPKAHRAVSAHDVDGVLHDSADPWLGEVSYEYAKKSQSKFGSRSIVELMTFVLAYMASFGMMWFISEQGGSISRSVPLMLGVWP